MNLSAAIAALDAALAHAEAQDAKDARGKRLVQVQHRDDLAWPNVYGMSRFAAALLGVDMDADDLGPEEIREMLVAQVAA